MSKEAERRAARLQDIFGRDNLFVEIQDHGIADQHRTNPQLIEIARRLDAPLLATNDSHYTHREDAVAHDALLCVQTGAPALRHQPVQVRGDRALPQVGRVRCATSSRRCPRRATTPCSLPSGPTCRSSWANRACPSSRCPHQFTGEVYEDRALAYLRDLTMEGARQRYGSRCPDNVVERLDYELGVIGNMGFAAYFLVVWDLIRFARTRASGSGPGRGSAAGCCVAYCLRIVDLDPIRYDLLFERFLNPGRKQMPDIDMDFDERYRADVMRYAAEKYGSDRVAQVVTFSTIKARAAVRDAARVLGKAYIVGDRIAKAMPPAGHGP